MPFVTVRMNLPPAHHEPKLPPFDIFGGQELGGASRFIAYQCMMRDIAPLDPYWL